MCLIVLAGLNLVSTNSLSTKGFSVLEYEKETLALEKENHMLSVKIEEATKLQNIEKLALSQGYTRTKNIVFVDSALTFAQR